MLIKVEFDDTTIEGDLVSMVGVMSHNAPEIPQGFSASSLYDCQFVLKQSDGEKVFCTGWLASHIEEVAT